MKRKYTIMGYVFECEEGEQPAHAVPVKEQKKPAKKAAPKKDK